MATGGRDPETTEDAAGRTSLGLAAPQASSAAPRLQVVDQEEPADDGPELTLEPGEVVGRYRVGDLIGLGGQAEVYLVHHVTLDAPFAMKVAYGGGPEQRERFRRFQREARLGARIRHRNVVSVVDAGTVRGTPYLVLELIEGETLASTLAHHRLGPAATAELGIQLLAAGQALAAEQIVHRDIKPENIMLSQGVDGDVRLQLLDFGVSKSDERDRRVSTITRQGALVGTPFYMSPEQVRGEAVDLRSDIYAISATLYECAAGRPPHDGPTLTSVLASVLAQPAAPIATYDPSCPPALAAVIERGLAPRPEDRFEHPREMAEALRQAAHQLGLPRGADAWTSFRSTRRDSTEPTVPVTLATASGARASAPPRREASPTPSRGSWLPARPVALAWSRALSVASVALLAVAVPFLLSLWSPWATGTPPSTRIEAAGAGAPAPAVADAPAKAAATPSTTPSTGNPTQGREDATLLPVPELERSARGLYLRGESTAALAIYQRIVEREPARASAWRDLGFVAEELGREATARSAFARYLELAPHADDAAAIRGRLAGTTP
ncbi:MAG: tetratricopeptide repeat protein [Sandaracinaceae bacterium]